MKSPARLTAVFAALVLCSYLSAASTAHHVTIAAATADRLALTGEFTLPPGAPSPAQLRDSAGHTYPLQIEANGQARFLIPDLRAGQTLALTLVTGTSAGSGVNLTRTKSDLGINVGDRAALVYQTDKEKLPRTDIDVRFKRAGYLHPVLSPAGAVVTGNFPSNHVHHHGIWSSWSKVQFQGRATNFWETIEQKGNTEFLGIERSWNGPVHGGFVARQQMVDFTGPKSTPAINESWEVTTWRVEGVSPAARVFDLLITQEATTSDPVVMPKNLYGGTSFRGRDEWNGKDNLVVLTSEGATTRETANMTRVRWCYFGGAVEGGGSAGIAMLSHPGNLSAPQPIRVHPDMPYVCFAPVQLGDVRIESGKPYTARYRFVVADGAPDRARLDAYWNSLAHPAIVTVDAK